MKKLLLASILIVVGAAGQAAPSGLDQAGNLSSVVKAADEGFAFSRLENGVQLRVNGVTKNILFYGPASVRVNSTLGETYTTQPSIVVVTNPAAVEFRVEDSAAALTLITPKLRVVADKKSGAAAFFRPDGQLVVRERSEKPVELKKVEISGAPTYDAKLTLTLSPDESLYGLGEYNEPYMDYRGKKVKLVQSNIGIVVPMLVSTKRYGIMWDIYSKAFFTDDASGATFAAESAPAGMDYYFFAGDNLDEVIAAYRQLTGPAPMFPKQAFGLFMSKERYKTQDRVVEVAQNFRKEGFPLDYMVQDWQYWGSDKDGTWSGMIWNKERYPHPEEMTKALHDMNMKLMISIWPSVGNDTELAKELDAKGLRFKPLHWISRKARIYDAFSPEGRAIYFKHIKSGLLDVGVDALWMDGTEVEVGGACHDPVGVERDIKNLGTNYMGDFTRYLNPYSLMTTKGTYEGQRATSNKRVLTLTRSSWTGQQRYAALPWDGDTTASWGALRNRISGGINVCMAGQPYWTQDTGGFFVNYRGGEKNPEYRELFARWHQFAIFNPLYRIHGASIEREPYIFKTIDPEMHKSLLSAAQLRYRLLPYIYSLAWQSTANGYTMMRGLPMDFPDDQKVRKTDDAFMFGPAFLAHPITHAMYNVSEPPAPTIPVDYLRTPDGQPGLAVQYFDGVNFDKPAGQTVDTKVEHRWPGPPLANPPPGLSGFENFSGRWEGTITAPEDGEYEIGFEVDDGARLWLDGKLVAEDWDQAAARWRSGKVTLQKDQKVAIKLDYFQGGMERYLRLGWRIPSQIRALASTKSGLNNTMETYLPQGAAWYDFWTNERFTGGQTVKRDCPLDILPLYVRAGTIVPMGPVVQYATEKPEAPYEIRIYPGANAKFTIYEDDNETYNYEKGQRATYDLVWNDATKTLTVGARQGSFPGMIATRKLNVVLAAPGQNAGKDEGSFAARTVEYTGRAVTVKFEN
ncbi:MAG TPA: TIM-barrel domain-containing protein [Candidatus Paceibacterota bacterium]|nr:TIM-barrel domain-containing protein [Candidatus Paceibacterota bacterium]